MARNKGLASFSANFEPQLAGPLDAREIVDTVADLLLPATWQANDGVAYTYVGMTVKVKNDGVNNGIYMLSSADYTDSASWTAIGGAGGSFEKILYTRSELFQAGSGVIDSYSQLSNSKGNKNVVASNVGLNSVYLNCFRDISEEMGGTIISETKGLRFADEAELKDWLVNNTDYPGSFTNNIIVEVYDLINPELTSPVQISMTNTLLNTLKGKGKSKSSNAQDLCIYSPIDNEKIEHTFYENFIETVINTMLPELGGSYVYNIADEPRKLIRTTRNRRTRFCLHNDQTKITWTNTDNRKAISLGAMVDPIDVPNYNQGVDWEELHSESMYATYNYNSGSATFSLFDKNNIPALLSEIKDPYSSICILYKTHCNYLGQDYYSVMLKPVGADALSVSGRDSVEYDVFMVSKSKNGYNYLNSIAIDLQSEYRQNKARINKSAILASLKAEVKQYPTEKPVRQAQIVFRDKVTGYISKPSKRYGLTTGKDRIQTISLLD